MIFGIAMGELTRPALVVYYAGCLVASYLLLLHAFTLLRPQQPRPARWITVLFTLHIGLGSTFFFLGNRAQVFHEAILSGAMFALFACWCALRHLATPHGRWWVGALGCAIAAVHARPPSGLFALAFVGCTAAVLTLRQWQIRAVQPGLARPLMLGVASVLGFGTFNAVSYLKFERFEGLPLQYHSQYPPERMAKVGNKGLHLVNLPHGFYTYFVRPNFHFERGFPWVYPESRTPRHVFPGTFTELPDPTVPLPWVMPAICALAVAGGAWAALKFSAARAPLAIACGAFVPMALVMFAAIGSTHRYTADFCPFLIGAATLGMAALESLGRTWRVICWSAVAGLTLWSCAMNPALALHAQGESDWVPPEANQRYQTLRRQADAFFGTEQRR